MLRALLSDQIDKLERAWNYDADYARLMNKVNPIALAKFLIGTQSVPRKDAPAAALAAAGIVGTLSEDCGPCTQISVDMAAARGVPGGVLCAILAGDETAMGESAALGYRFARATLERRLEETNVLRDEVVRRWGEKGLVGLALALTTARMYPTLKYALGYGKVCSRVVVAGEPTPFRAPLNEAANAQ